LRAYLRFRLGDAVGALEALRDAFAHARDTGVLGQLAGALEHGVDILAALGHAAPAAVFVGALERGIASSLAFVVVGPTPADLEHAMGEVRATLDAATFEQLAARGGAMPLEDLVDYARDALDHVLAELEHDNG